MQHRSHFATEALVLRWRHWPRKPMGHEVSNPIKKFGFIGAGKKAGLGSLGARGCKCSDAQAMELLRTEVLDRPPGPVSASLSPSEPKPSVAAWQASSFDGQNWKERLTSSSLPALLGRSAC